MAVVGISEDTHHMATGDIHRVHVDYRDALEVTGISIGLAGGR